MTLTRCKMLLSVVALIAWCGDVGHTADNGLVGSYFSNENLTGPVVVQRLDPQIGFNWGAGSPATLLPADRFSACWMGYVQPLVTEDLTLIARTDDGVRVWIDGVMVVNAWAPRSVNDSLYTFPAIADRRYLIRVEYREQAGVASASLLWQSATQPRQVIPSDRLQPLPPIVASIPSRSRVSPAFIEGYKLPSATVTAKSGVVLQLPRKVDHHSQTAFHTNIPLVALVGVPVLLNSGKESISGEIAWEPTLISGEAEVVLRIRDALLLKVPVSGSLQVTYACGILSNTGVPIPAIPEIPLPLSFNKPGTYTIVARNVTGTEVGRLAITAVDVNFDGPVACEVGYARSKGVEILGGDPAAVAFTSADDGNLVVSPIAPTDFGVRISLKPLRRGSPVVLARLQTASGSIIARQELDEFTLETQALRDSVVNNETNSATAALIMRPYIPNIDGIFTMFAHRATFEGGAKKLIINSNVIEKSFDPESNETIGTFFVGLEIPPDEDLYCFRLLLDQHSKYGTSVSTENTINGKSCRYRVSELFVCAKDTVDKVLPVVAIKKSSKSEIHTLTITKTGAGKGVPDPKTHDCSKDPNWNPKVRLNGLAAGRYTVKIDQTDFGEKLIVLADTGVGLQREKSSLELCQSNTLKAVVCMSADSYKFEIRFADESTWYTLQDTSSNTYTGDAKVAGKFKVKVTAKKGSETRTSNEEDIEVMFPSIQTIISDGTVSAKMAAVFAATKAAATPASVLEIGFFMQLDTSGCTYGFVAESSGTPVPPTGLASWDTAPRSRPADDPASRPTPLGSAKYTVAWYHSHPPLSTAPASFSRPVGPSGNDRAYGARMGVPGIAHDYVGTGGLLRGGHNINDPASPFTIAPDRRATP